MIKRLSTTDKRQRIAEAKTFLQDPAAFDFITWESERLSLERFQSTAHRKCLRGGASEDSEPGRFHKLISDNTFAMLRPLHDVIPAREQEMPSTLIYLYRVVQDYKNT